MQNYLYFDFSYTHLNGNVAHTQTIINYKVNTVSF